jgi:FtsZ-interacting cell division protein ZipA
MPVELLAILAVVVIALVVGLWRTRHERAAARRERA